MKKLGSGEWRWPAQDHIAGASVRTQIFLGMLTEVQQGVGSPCTRFPSSQGSQRMRSPCSATPAPSLWDAKGLTCFNPPLHPKVAREWGWVLSTWELEPDELAPAPLPPPNDGL